MNLPVDSRSENKLSGQTYGFIPAAVSKRQTQKPVFPANMVQFLIIGDRNFQRIADPVEVGLPVLTGNLVQILPGLRTTAGFVPRLRSETGNAQIRPRYMLWCAQGEHPGKRNPRTFPHAGHDQKLQRLKYPACAEQNMSSARPAQHPQSQHPAHDCPRE